MVVGSYELFKGSLLIMQNHEIELENNCVLEFGTHNVLDNCIHAYEYSPL